MLIQFLTLNLFMGKFLDNALDFIKELKPDVMTLQEVFEGEVTERIRTIGYPYSAFAATHLQDDKKRGNIIFSKYPLEEGPTTFFDVPYSEDYVDIPENFPFAPRLIHEAKVNVNGTILNIFNTHGIWGLDGKDSDRRLKMSEIIVAQIKDKKNVILAGDFNLQPNTQTIANIENYLKNVFKDELTSTFNMKHKTNPGYATAVVDMIFVSREMKVIEHSCPQVDVSDHLPLVCTVEV